MAAGLAGAGPAGARHRQSGVARTALTADGARRC